MAPDQAAVYQHVVSAVADLIKAGQAADAAGVPPVWFGHLQVAINEVQRCAAELLKS